LPPSRARGTLHRPQDIQLLFYAFASERELPPHPTAPGADADRNGDASGRGTESGFGFDGEDAQGDEEAVRTELVVDYARFVEAMTTGQALGPLAGQDFVTVISDRHGERPREGKRTYEDRLFNKPPPYALGDTEPNPAPRRIVEKTTNTPSIAGGIFGPAPPIVAPTHPSIKNRSTVTLEHSQWARSSKGETAAAFGETQKRMSNSSSVPGGIFASGRTEDFRVRGVFVRPGY
jgi:hypothetical protein